MVSARAQKFSRIITTVPRAIAEPFGSALVELGAGAIEERPTRHADTVEILLSLPAGEAVEPWQGVIRSLYQAFAEELEVDPEDFTMRTEHHELDYHAGWLKHLSLVPLTPTLALAPEGDPTETPEGATRLVYVPHPSFGDGTHVTTRLAARALERCLANTSMAGAVLDVGTGNGVLALVAAHAGKSVLGIDIDPEAVSIAHTNAEKNGLDALCRFETTPLEAIQKKFELVVANLEPRTQLELAKEIASHTKANGTVLLTGFLGDQSESIVEPYHELGFEVVETTTEDDYALLRLFNGTSVAEVAR
ncbi:MAG: 50S ribosomal protein L11 methyltransferase [Polyangiaceae bacterium]